MSIVKVVKFPKKYIYLTSVCLIFAIFLGYLCVNSDYNNIDYKSYILDTNNPIYSNDKVAYLTFDDGPSENTEKLLGYLKDADVKATFFVIGENWQNKEKREQLYKMIVEENHLIALHTFYHDYNKIYKTAETYIENLTRLQTTINDITGVSPTIFRFPGGSSNNFCSKEKYDTIVKKTSELGMTFFDWNVDSKDAIGSPKSKEHLISSVVNDSIKMTNPIILMHDTASTLSSIEAIPEIISQLRQKGYRFDILKNCEYTIHQNKK